jgi:hypothetical protein
MSVLLEQIDEARMQVHTDSYPMSIGELVNWLTYMTIVS